MNQQIDYAKKFDEFVSEYDKWLASLENPKVLRRNRWSRWSAFFIGVGSLLDISGALSFNRLGYSHPLYFREDLTPEQKDAIVLASDWQKVDRTLDNIISGNSSNGKISVEEATAGKYLVKQMYEHFRNVYVAHAMR